MITHEIPITVTQMLKEIAAREQEADVTAEALKEMFYPKKQRFMGIDWDLVHRQLNEDPMVGFLKDYRRWTNETFNMAWMSGDK